MALSIGYLFSILAVIFFIIIALVIATPTLEELYLKITLGFQRTLYNINGREQFVSQNIDQQHPFYQTLNAKQRKEFLWRLYHFIDTTDFVIKFKGDEARIKTTIAFTAVQMAFGLTMKCFTQYGRIIVYEEDYFSQRNQRYHKGEVHPGAGTILFSWNSALFGLSDHYDGINLLIHEFAHALRLEHKMRNDQYEIFDDDAFAAFEKQAEASLETIRTTDDHFFRKYAATNLDEFFAVASENFFERPRELNNNFPKLYEAFKKLYNQDTLNRLIPNPNHHESNIK